MGDPQQLPPLLPELSRSVCMLLIDGELAPLSRWLLARLGCRSSLPKAMFKRLKSVAMDCAEAQRIEAYRILSVCSFHANCLEATEYHCRQQLPELSSFRMQLAMPAHACMHDWAVWELASDR